MANYKTSWVQRLIDGAWQKTFAFAHAKTVYTDFANKKTLADKLSEIDAEIGNKANKTEIPTELPANGGNSATVNGHTVKSDVPENAVFTDTVYDDTEIQKRISDVRKKTTVNLLNPTLETTTHYGVTCTNNGDGTYTLNGTSTFEENDFYFKFNNNFLTVGNKYKYLCVRGNNSSYIYNSKYYNETEDGITFTASVTDFRAFFRCNNGVTYNNFVCKPILTTNLNATYDDFVPFTGDSGSLNRDVSDLRGDVDEMLTSVSDVRKETTVNLLKPTLETTTDVNNITYKNNGDGTYTISGTSTTQIVKHIADNIVISQKCVLTGCKGGSQNTYSLGVFDGENYYEVMDERNKEIPANTYQYAYIVVRSGVTIPDNTIIKPMITTNLDATYDDFVPYTGYSGSLNGDVSEKAPKKNPVFTGSISLGRKAGTAVGKNSTAEGSNTTAIGSFSHAEGNGATASGDTSHAEGYKTTASGDFSHAEGRSTVSLDYQHAGGHYNNTNTATASKSSGTGTGTSFVIGNGIPTSKSNAFRVDDNGTPYSKAGLNTTGADYAEFFEWEDGNENNEDRRGYFVTLDGKHIKIAKEGDWILGIVSGFPAIIGNGDEEWKGRYIFDDFGCPVIEEFEYEEEEYETITNDDGEEEVITKKVKKTGTKWKEVPEYDPTQPYTGRMQRKEWSAIGMLGVLSVRDDGSCKVNGFCKLADGGIATDSDTGYRVVKRVTDNIVEVIFK